MTNTIQDDVLLYSHSMNNRQGGLGGQHVPHDDISALRIRIPVVRDEEEEEHTVTPYQEEYSYRDYEGEYDPYDGYDPWDDLDNHYACLEYFELLRKARLQLMTDPESDTDPFDIFSPIPVINDYD